MGAKKPPDKIQWDNLPLASSIPELKRLKKREARLEQILRLPLDGMFQYATPLDGENDGLVACNLCSEILRKEDWIDAHFRFIHHAQYKGVTSNTASTGDEESEESEESDEWISLLDIQTEKPIRPCDGDPKEDNPSRGNDPWAGSILIRRFVVVQQGINSSLCLGIHT
jgi:hypothetical protein